jgi:hypothetical protein
MAMPSDMGLISQKELMRILNYNSFTGIFTWKIKVAPRVKIGDIAGGLHSQGYICISIEKKQFRAHRLAWLYYYGYLPENQIDHKDQIKINNWISNLRETSTSCNVRNTGNYNTNTSGVRGVSWDKIRQKWGVSIKPEKGKRIFTECGEFDEAVCFRLAMEQCLDWSNCNSNSPAYLYVRRNIQGLK